MIRIPDSLPHSRRIEFRLPSPQNNPYHVMIFLLTGILEGLNNKAIVQKCIYGNAYDPQYGLRPIVFSSKTLRLFENIVSSYL